MAIKNVFDSTQSDKSLDMWQWVNKIECSILSIEQRLADLERMTKTLNDSIAALSKPDPVAAAHDRLERAAFDQHKSERVTDA